MSQWSIIKRRKVLNYRKKEDGECEKKITKRKKATHKNRRKIINKREMKKSKMIRSKRLKKTVPTKVKLQKTVRRSVQIPLRFWSCLEGNGGCLLYYLQGHYSVTIVINKRKMHIKGTTENVVKCYIAVKELVAEWKVRKPFVSFLYYLDTTELLS